MTQVIYNTQKVGLKNKTPLFGIDYSTEYIIKQEIARTKFKALEYMIAQGLVPCGEAHLSFEIRLEQRTLPIEATGGKVITVPETMSHVVFESAWNEWLDTTPWG